MQTQELAAKQATKPSTEESPEALVRQGRDLLALYDAEGYEQAVSLFHDALEAAPSFVPAYVGLAEAYAYWGFRKEIGGEECQSLYDMSVQYAEMGLRMAPERADTHRATALSLRRGEKASVDRRREEILIALDLDPGDAESWWEYWRVGGYDLDENAVRRALQLEPRLCGVHIDLGAVLCEKGLHEQAAEEFIAALKINPRNALAHYDLSMTLDRMGQPERAKALLEKALRMHPEDPLLETGLGYLRPAA